jgi:hypothetical protein
LSDVLNAAPLSVQFQLDNKGRILSETRRDDKGNVTGTLSNTWDGERIVTITWESPPDDTRVVNFSYNDDGDRVREENWRRGVLDRDVVTETVGGDTIEIETLYLDEKPVLRARWVNGKKVSEEPLDRPRGRKR